MDLNIEHLECGKCQRMLGITILSIERHLIICDLLSPNDVHFRIIPGFGGNKEIEVRDFRLSLMSINVLEDGSVALRYHRNSRDNYTFISAYLRIQNDIVNTPEIP